MPTPVIIYPFDPTGVAATNKIVNESKTLAATSVRSIALDYAPFFERGIRLVESGTNRLLTYGTDYVFAELQQTATIRTGQPVSSLILITNNLVASTVLVTYQCVGGDFTYSPTALQNLVQAQLNTSNIVSFSNIINKPDGYAPNAHLHDASDLFGAESIVQAIDRLANAVSWGDSPVFYALVNLINSSVNGLRTEFNSIYQQNLQTAIANMGLLITPTSIGLGNVKNYPEATYASGRNIGILSNGLSSNLPNTYITTLGLLGFRDTFLSQMVNSGSGLGNIYGTVKPPTRANLSILTNGGTFITMSQQALNSGNTAFEAMTLPPGGNATDSYVVTKLSNNSNNTGGTFLYTHVQNAKMWVASTANELTWPTFNEVILADRLQSTVTGITNLMAQHIQNYDNPHNVTSSQIGLGLLENLQVADNTDLALNRSVRKYVTVEWLQAWMLKWGASVVNGTTSTSTATSQGTVYTATLRIESPTHDFVGYLFAASDTKDPAATVPYATKDGTVLGYGYPVANATASIGLQETNTGVTSLYMMNANTITVSNVITNVNASCVSSIAPQNVVTGTSATVTMTFNGLTAGKTYVIVPQLTNPTHNTSSYQLNGQVISMPVVASATGTGAISFQLQTAGMAVGSWVVGARGTTATENLTIVSTNGGFTIVTSV